MVCLDTTFFADLSRNRPDARRKLGELREAGQRLVTTVVTLGELYVGAWSHPRGEAEMRRIDELLQGFILLEMNMASAREYGRLKAFLRKRGSDVGERDLFIAAIALAYGESRIVTRNAKDFGRIPGIEVLSSEGGEDLRRSRKVVSY